MNDTAYLEDYYDYYERGLEFRLEALIGVYLSPVLLVGGIVAQSVSLLALVRLVGIACSYTSNSDHSRSSDTTSTTTPAQTSACIYGVYYLVTLTAVDLLLVVHRLGNQCTRRLFDFDLQVSVGCERISVRVS